MDEFTVDAFVNRDDAVPLLVVEHADDSGTESAVSDRERKRDRFKKKSQTFKDGLKKAQEKTQTKAAEGSSMQDRLMEKLLAQVIPLEDATSSQDENLGRPDFVTRPSFSIPTMSANFRRFNSRIGVVFVFQVKAVRLLSWNTPTHTLSFLAIYSFICLDPYLLSVLPLALVLLALLIPSFIARHPPQPQTITPQTSANTTSFRYSTAGPPIAPAPTVKPVKELSKDFFRNMRDLQNSMEDFSIVHDQIVAFLTPPTNFSNEPLSSTLFLFFFIASLILFIASHLLPWRLIFLVAGWTTICLGHPAIQRQMLSAHKQVIAPREKQAKSWLDHWIANDIILDSAPETREVEIFELQYQESGSGEWQSWLFSSSPYDPLSIERVRSERPKGTRFFEDVLPPHGWEWSEKKWALDLWSREWVEERIITGVEVETEGERWVYDIRYEYDNNNNNRHSRNSSLDDGLVYGESSWGTLTPQKIKSKLKEKEKARLLPSWEEGSEAESEGRGRRGEWRRRRWVRLVKRKWLAPKDAEGKS